MGIKTSEINVDAIQMGAEVLIVTVGRCHVWLYVPEYSIACGTFSLVDQNPFVHYFCA